MGCFVEHFRGAAPVLIDPLAVGQHQPECQLRIGVAKFRSLFIPPGRLLQILGNAEAL